MIDAHIAFSSLMDLVNKLEIFPLKLKLQWNVLTLRLIDFFSPALVFLLVAPFLCPLFASAFSADVYKLIFREELCALGQVTCTLAAS